MQKQTTAIYSFLKENEIQQVASFINDDLERLTSIYAKYYLALKLSKSYMMVFGQNFDRNRCKQLLNLVINGKKIAIVESARNLGICLDQDLHFHKYINYILRNVNNNLS